MSVPAKEALWALTEKEKQTLRLIVRGHDAKSTARRLGLSVHTINERLRDARRKMAVSSSREAARLLLEAEHGDPASPPPNSLGDSRIGEDAIRPPTDQEDAPVDGVGRPYRRPGIIIGVLLMTFVLGLLALAAWPQAGSPPPPAAAAASSVIPEVRDAAQQWLMLVDQGRWDESYQATGTAFRTLNTRQTWAAASDEARGPLGAMLSRTFLSEETLPAPPSGYEVVKFRTNFANKADVLETVTLDREGGLWRVVGVMIG
jgi:DNA-binding CsgD family transcriptional regulator